MYDDLIRRSALLAALLGEGWILPAKVRWMIERAPAVDAVQKEKYDELRESFVDYVCSGITNPAPYCKNRCTECLDSYGWCRNDGENCAGFDPDKDG